MPQPAQLAALVVLSAVLAALLLWLHAPAALMLGPLLAAHPITPRACWISSVRRDWRATEVASSA